MSYDRPTREVPEWSDIMCTEVLKSVMQRLTAASQTVPRAELQLALYHCLLTTIPGCYGEEFNFCRFGDDHSPGISVKPGDIEIRIKFEGVKVTDALIYVVKLSELKLPGTLVNLEPLNRIIRAYYKQEKEEAEIFAVRPTPPWTQPPPPHSRRPRWPRLY